MKIRTPLTPEERYHRDGVSCGRHAAYVYDANGHGRWCIDCGAELGEQSWHPDGADVPSWAIGAAITLLGGILLVVVLLMALGGQGANRDDRGGTGGGATVLPSTYGPPEPDQNRVPDSGSRPSAASLPLVWPSHVG